MHQIILLGILFGGKILLGATQGPNLGAQRDICYFPKKYNYPCEVHSITTTDGYILSAIRIPYSPHESTTTEGQRPVVFLMHGLIWSSDCWLIPDSKVTLAYMLADAGYDVWLGNNRGNTHSKKHVWKSAFSPSFWEFSWHEIGVYDLPATIDYILAWTNQSSLHYVGHSQGTTVFLVWLSTHPQESVKVKTSHLLAPVCFMDHMPTPFIDTFAAIFGPPNPAINAVSSLELGGRSELIDALPQTCSEGSLFRDLCQQIFFFISGYSTRFNMTLLSDMFTTYPAGSSMRQYVHYLQEYTSKHFRQYDYGEEENRRVYSSDTPPNYKIMQIQPTSPINLYYGNKDIVVAPIDVQRFANIMGDNVELNPIEGRDYCHLDFLMATDNKEVINDCVLAKIEKYEGKPFKNSSCCGLSNKCSRSY